MKKTYWIGLVVLALAILVTNVSSQTGAKFYTEMEKSLNHLNLTLEDNQVQQGWFSSSGQQTFSIKIDESLSLWLINNWQAQHFPGWVVFKGATSFDFAGDLALAESLKNVALELGLAKLPYSGSANWNKAKFVMQLANLDATEDLEFSWSGFNLQAVNYYSGLQEGSLVLDKFVREEKSRYSYNNNSFSLTDLLLSWNQEGTYPWVNSTVEASVASMVFAGGAGFVTTELVQPQLQQSLALSPETFAYSYVMDLGKILLGGEEMGSGKLHLTTADIAGQPVADIIQVLAQNTAYTDLTSADVEQLNAAADKILQGSPKILLQELDFLLEGPLVFGLQAEGSLGFDGTNLPTDYLRQLEEGAVAVADLVQRLVVEINFNLADDSLLMFLGLPEGLLNPDLEHQSLVFVNGQLNLNGQPIF